MEHLAAVMTKVAATLQAPVEVTQTLAAITAAAVDTMPRVDFASVSLTGHDGRIVTLAPTSPTAEHADQIQYRVGQGPCLDAVLKIPVVIAEDLATDLRWPVYGPAAAELGVGSQIAFQFRAKHNHVRGGLNLYSYDQGPVDAGTLQLGTLYAAQLAVAMGWERHEQDLRTAIASRELIGTAVGILMERYKLDQERAFGFLLRASQDGNVKLRDIAASIVDQAVAEAETGS